jgi:hypothetical protein
MARGEADAVYDASLYLPDIIVTDVVVPAADRIRLVRALKEEPSLGDISAALTPLPRSVASRFWKRARDAEQKPLKRLI